MSMREALKPKSDQLNADDLIGNITKTITITKVDVKVGSEQPIVVHYQGGTGKPWKPCKTTGRILMALWGEDETQYIGRTLELYRDNDVRFGGDIVGGIRIKAMSHIAKREVLSLQISKGKTKRYTIEPLQTHAPKAETQPQEPTLAQKEALQKIEAKHTELLEIVGMISSLEHVSNFLAQQEKTLTYFADKYPDKHTSIMDALQAKQDALKAPLDTERCEETSDMFGDVA